MKNQALEPAADASAAVVGVLRSKVSRPAGRRAPWPGSCAAFSLCAVVRRRRRFLSSAVALVILCFGGAFGAPLCFLLALSEGTGAAEWGQMDVTLAVLTGSPPLGVWV